jgi:DNA-binding NarL/FixJ family response regulator
MAGVQPLRILLVDDGMLARMGLRAALRDHPGIRAVVHVSSAEQALAKTAESRPDVVVIDSLARAVDAVATARMLADRCRAERPPAMLILIEELNDHVRQVLDVGGRGVLLHRASADQFVSAIRLVAAGFSLLAPVESRPWRMVRAVPANRAGAGGTLLGRLTRRERDVLHLIAKGYTNAEVSDALVLSESTVRSHTRHILEKLEVRSRLQAAIYAHEHGLVTADPADAERPKTERPKAERPKTERPKTERPKTERPKAERPKTVPGKSLPEPQASRIRSRRCSTTGAINPA